MHPAENGEIPPELQFENFMRSFEGVEILNSDGKKITLHSGISQNPLYESTNVPLNKRHWALTFAGYPGESPFIGRVNQQSENYVRFSLALDESEQHPGQKDKIITVDYAQLTHPDLKSKEVYSKIRELISKNFPETFILHTEIDNERTKKQLLDLKKAYNSKTITFEEFEQKLLENYIIQERLRVGFNSLTVNYENDEIVEILATKHEGPPKITITEEGKKLTK